MITNGVSLQGPFYPKEAGISCFNIAKLKNVFLMFYSILENKGATPIIYIFINICNL